MAEAVVSNDLGSPLGTYSSLSGTEAVRSRTPAGNRQTSPKSEFGYDDAYSTHGDDFAEGSAQKTTRMITRRKSSKSTAVFKTAKRASFLAPTSCSTVKQRSKVIVVDTPKKPVTEVHTGAKPTTIPISPHFRRRPTANSNEVKLTSEQMMLQKLEQEKAQESERAAKAKKLYAMLKARSNRRSSKLAGKLLPGSATKATPKKERKFTKPRNVPAPAPVTAVKKGPGGLTLVEPFSFATDKRLPTPAVPAADADVVIPTAELAQHFMRDARSHGAPETAAVKVTVGHSPKLRTKKRGQFAASRPKPLTREEREAQEMEEISKRPFKALQLDRRIFDSAGELGVPKVAARPVTEPVEFEFRAEKRCGRLASTTASLPSPPKTFKAKPAPKLPAKAKSPKPKATFKPTVALSPKFRGGARASMAPERRQRARFSATLPAPTTTSKSTEPPKATEPKEFKFATKGRSEFHKQQLEKQLAAEEAALAAARERKAQPVPDFDKIKFQPDLAAHRPAPTEPKPFNLRSCARHEEAQSSFAQEVQALQEQAKPVDFHARPVPPTNYKPDAVFVEPKDHAPVVPLPITLESDKRAAKRQAFDQIMGQKMAQLEAMQEAIARQRAEQEEKQLQALRRKSVEEGGLMFRAKPILTKDLFPAKAVTPLPPTTPLSPQLRTKTRRSSASVNAHNTVGSAVAFETLASASVGDAPAAGLGKPLRRSTRTKEASTGKGKGVAAAAEEAESAHQQELAAALSAM